MTERPRKLGDFKKERVNSGTDNHSLKGFSQVSHTGELNWQRSSRSAVDFYSKKTKKSLFQPPFWALRSNVRTPSMAHWKARVRLYIRRNRTFFAISYGWDVMNRNRSKSAFFEGGGSIWAQISEGRGHHPPTTVGIRVAEWVPFRVVSKYMQCVI